MSEYRKARALAGLLHRGQVDKAGRPMFDHVRRVAERTEYYGEATVAFLHDIVEDTPCTIHDLERLGFSKSAVESVDALTRRKGEVYKDYLGRVRDDVDGVAVAVKLADLADHLEPVEGFELPESLAKRYRDAVAFLGGS